MTDPVAYGVHPTLASQSYASVVVFGPDWRVTGLSQSAAVALGLDPGQCFGASIEAVFAPETVHRLRSRSQVLSDADPVMQIANCPYGGAPDGRHVTALFTAGCFAFAIEPEEAGAVPCAEVEQVMRLIRRVAHKATPALAATEAVRALRALTMMDSISLHLLEGGVVQPAFAQVSSPPPVARLSDGDLRLITAEQAAWAQYLPDLEAAADVLWSAVPPGQAFDFGYLPSRLAPPGLAQAFRQAGVRAAMMLPVLRHERLWAVMLGQNPSPVLPSFAQRGMIDLFVTLLGHTLASTDARVSQVLT